MKRTRPTKLSATGAFLIVSMLAMWPGDWVLEAKELSVSSSAVSVTEVVKLMEERSREREQRLQNFSVERRYAVENERIKKSAEEKAAMIFLAPGEKLFEIESHSGSGFMRRGVINRLIDTEQKNAQPDQKPRSAITSANYEFEWVGTEVVQGRLQYVLHAKPRRKDTLLFDAKIWVDAEDFAVARIEGRPAKRPSFWTRKIEFTHEYGKFGPFWLPVRDSSVTHVFLFGKTRLDIEYKDYRINRPELVERAAAIRHRGTQLEIQIDPKDKEGKTDSNP